MALRKVKGNLERMFDKNLTDLVRGIRNNKETEVSVCVCRQGDSDREAGGGGAMDRILVVL